MKVCGSIHSSGCKRESVSRDQCLPWSKLEHAIGLPQTSRKTLPYISGESKGLPDLMDYFVTDCPTEDFPAVPKKLVTGGCPTEDYLTVNHTVDDHISGHLPIRMWLSHTLARMFETPVTNVRTG